MHNFKPPFRATSPPKGPTTHTPRLLPLNPDIRVASTTIKPFRAFFIYSLLSFLFSPSFLDLQAQQVTVSLFQLDI